MPYGSFPAYPLDLCCCCGEHLRYVFATAEGSKEAQQRWKAKHCGFGHFPIDVDTLRRLQKEEAKKAADEAKRAEGTFEFMKEGEGNANS